MPLRQALCLSSKHDRALPDAAAQMHP